ncbi:MAG: hypothetical protein ABSD27_14865, partial [Bryobacteraceae bacterium]
SDTSTFCHGIVFHSPGESSPPQSVKDVMEQCVKDVMELNTSACSVGFEPTIFARSVRTPAERNTEDAALPPASADCR